jgi:hypothetical protein
MNKANVAISLAAVLLLTGCASTQTQRPSSAGAQAGRSSGGSSTGMPMAATSDTPSATAKMVCGDDIRGKVAQVLKLSAPPKTETSWADQLYTCTYRLPMGPMVLSVKQSAGKAAAAGYFTNLRPTLGSTETLQGLGERSYGTGDGVVVVIKDAQTLTVDTTGLPKVFGPDGQRRADLAFEIASDVLGCWTGDE